MIILLAVAVGIVLSLAAGGQIQNLLNSRFRLFGLLFIPLILQAVLFSPLGTLLQLTNSIGPWIYLLSMLLACIVVVWNLHLPGFALLLLGVVSNLLVIAANGGAMPVSPIAREIAGMPPLVGVSNNVIGMTPSSVFWFLGDLYPIPHAIPLANVFSPGDVLLALGGFVFAYRSLLPHRQVSSV